jgi:uncharacterized membrane protein YqjE
MALATDSQRRVSDRFRDVKDEAMSMRGEATEIASELQQLVRMEMELAQAEVQEAKQHATRGTMFGAMALELAMLMSVFLFLAIMFAIDTALPLWAAALITTGIVALLAAILGLLAKQQWSKFSPMPKRAIRTMQEDLKWAKSQIRSNAT